MKTMLKLWSAIAEVVNPDMATIKTASLIRITSEGLICVLISRLKRSFLMYTYLTSFQGQKIVMITKVFTLFDHLAWTGHTGCFGAKNESFRWIFVGFKCCGIGYRPSITVLFEIMQKKRPKFAQLHIRQHWHFKTKTDTGCSGVIPAQFGSPGDSRSHIDFRK